MARSRDAWRACTPTTYLVKKMPIISASGTALPATWKRARAGVVARAGRQRPRRSTRPGPRSGGGGPGQQGHRRIAEGRGDAEDRQAGHHDGHDRHAAQAHAAGEQLLGAEPQQGGEQDEHPLGRVDRIWISMVVLREGEGRGSRAPEGDGRTVPTARRARHGHATKCSRAAPVAFRDRRTHDGQRRLYRGFTVRKGWALRFGDPLRAAESTPNSPMSSPIPEPATDHPPRDPPCSLTPAALARQPGGAGRGAGRWPGAPGT